MTYSNTSNRIQGGQAYLWRPIRKKSTTTTKPKTTKPDNIEKAKSQSNSEK